MDLLFLDGVFQGPTLSHRRCVRVKEKYTEKYLSSMPEIVTDSFTV